MYNGKKVYDIHGHVSSPNATSGYLAGMLASNSITPTPLSRPADRRGPGLSDEDFQREAARHAKYMDDRQIDVQVIGHRPFRMLGFMEPHLLPQWVGFTNECIKKQVDFFPDRFIGAATLPQISEAPDLSNCLPELNRCVKEFGFKAVYLSPDPGGKRTTPAMYEPYWYPVYEYCQREGLPIIIHGTNSLDRRFRIVPQNYQLGFYTEQYIATQTIGHSDLFERYPELKIVVCHLGGGLDRFIKTDNHLPQKDLSKNLFFDTCAYELNFLEAGIKQKGVSRILFGTEAPGSGQAVRPETGKTSDDIVPILAAASYLSEQDKEDIMHNNPLKFLPAFEKVGAPAAG